MLHKLIYILTLLSCREISSCKSPNPSLIFFILGLFSSDLTLSWRRFLSYSNQPIDSVCKLIDWFLHDREKEKVRHEKVKIHCIGTLLSVIFFSEVIHPSFFTQNFSAIAASFDQIFRYATKMRIDLFLSKWYKFFLSFFLTVL